MKKNFLLILAIAFISILFAQNVNSQITVTVTNPTNTTPNLSVSYASLSLALTDLNAVTAMTGPVTLTLDAGTSETAPPTGFTIGSASLNPVLSATNTVTIIKAGGTVTINAGVGTATPTSAAPDGMLKINGADYITIDGLTFTDGNAANPATMEFGIGLFKLSLSDGAQNNTIQNCIFNMQRINNASSTAPMVEGSVGILMINSTSIAATTVLVPTTAAGSNSFNKFYTNTINGGNYGMALIGYAAASPFTAADFSNDVGGSSGATGNQILNFGGGAATNPSAGIRTLAQYTLNVSFNTLNNNNGGGVNHTTTLRGIYLNTAVSANANINTNTITIHGGGTSAQVAAIENVSGSTAASNTININSNTITGDYLTATTGVFYGIFNSATPATVNINSNSVYSLTYSGAALAGSGALYPIYNSGAATNVNIRANTVNTISRTGTTGGTTIGIFVSAGTNQTVNFNTVSNMSINGTGTASIMYGIQTSGTTVVCDTNTVNNLSVIKTTGTGALYGIYNFGSPTNENFNFNQVSFISHSGTGITYGIYTNTATGTRKVSNNLVHTVNTAGTTVAGITQNSSSPNIFKNKIYNIKSFSVGAPIVSGIILASVGTAGSATIYNNLIGDLTAPNASSTSAILPTLRGINVTSATASSSVNIYNNTVFLNASTIGVNFATTALWATTSATGTTAALTIRNNAFVNLSTPAGVGLTVAYQRSSTTLTNYAAASNTNLFYGGAADASHLIFYDGTNAVQTIAAFKTLVSSREANSATENPTFLSTVGSSSDFLKVNTVVPTQLESGGATISTPAITDDYYNNARYPNPGYPEDPGNPATAPDIGANEFGGVPVDLNPPNITYTVLTNTSSTSDRILTSTITDISGVPIAGALQPRIYYRKNAGSYFSSQGVKTSGSATNGVWDFTIVAADMGGVTASDVIGYFVIAQDIIGPYITSNPAAGLVATDVNTVSTPPTTPNTYTIVGIPLSGDFTVGTTMFRAVTGLNIQFETRIRKVMKEIPIESDNSFYSGKNKGNAETKQHLFGEKYEKGKSTMAEVDEIYSVPMLNGKEYRGELYHELTTAEKRNFNIRDNVNGVYATITAAAADVNLRGVGATDCRLLLTDAVYNTGSGETFPIIISSATQLPTATSQLIIKPNTGVTAQVSEVSATGIFVSRAPYVVFDGTAEGNTGTRDLTVTNTSTAANTYVIGLFNNTAPNKADHNTIKYCNVTGGMVTAATNAIYGIRNPVACIALHVYPDQNKGELACLSVRPSHENQGLGRRMVQFVEDRAREAGIEVLIALSTQTFNFFRSKAGFADGTPADLPPERRERYEQSGRRSRVLVKTLVKRVPPT